MVVRVSFFGRYGGLSSSLLEHTESLEFINARQLVATSLEELNKQVEATVLRFLTFVTQDRKRGDESIRTRERELNLPSSWYLGIGCLPRPVLAEDRPIVESAATVHFQG